jgi:hypothetical protein
MRCFIRSAAVLALAGAITFGLPADPVEAGGVGAVPAIPVGRHPPARKQTEHHDTHHKDAHRRTTKVSHTNTTHNSTRNRVRRTAANEHLVNNRTATTTTGRRVTTAGVTARQASAGRVVSEPGNLYVLSVEIDCALLDKKEKDPNSKEAPLLANVLRQKGLYQHVYTRVLTKQRASRAGILAGLDWLERSVSDRDVAVIFYSAHGTYAGYWFFGTMPAGYKGVQDPKKTMLFGQEIREALLRIHGRKVMLLESCCAAGLLHQPVRVKAIPNTLIITSCKETEHSASNLGYALIDGLSGKAAGSNGVVTSQSLNRYVHNRVAKETRNGQHVVSRQPKDMKPIALTHR